MILNEKYFLDIFSLLIVEREMDIQANLHREDYVSLAKKKSVMHEKSDMIFHVKKETHHYAR